MEVLVSELSVLLAFETQGCVVEQLQLGLEHAPRSEHLPLPHEQVKRSQVSDQRRWR